MTAEFYTGLAIGAALVLVAISCAIWFARADAYRRSHSQNTN